MFGNETSRQAFKVFEKYPVDGVGYLTVSDIIEVDAMVTASIYGMCFAASHLSSPQWEDDIPEVHSSSGLSSK